MTRRGSPAHAYPSKADIYTAGNTRRCAPRGQPAAPPTSLRALPSYHLHVTQRFAQSPAIMVERCPPLAWSAARHRLEWMGAIGEIRNWESAFSSEEGAVRMNESDQICNRIDLLRSATYSGINRGTGEKPININ